MDPLKPHQIRVYLSQDQAQLLEKLSDRSRLSQSQLVTLFVCAALDAVDENKGVFPVPLQLHIAK